MQKHKWNTLEQRPIWTDVTLMHEEVNQLIAVSISYQPSLATVRGTRNSHCLKFLPYHCQINLYQHSFFPRTIYYWNTLPESVILSSLLEEFKSEPPAMDSLHRILRYKQWPVQCIYTGFLFVCCFSTFWRYCSIAGMIISSPINVRNGF